MTTEQSRVISFSLMCITSCEAAPVKQVAPPPPSQKYFRQERLNGGKFPFGVDSARLRGGRLFRRRLTEMSGHRLPHNRPLKRPHTSPALAGAALRGTAGTNLICGRIEEEEDGRGERCSAWPHSASVSQVIWSATRINTD